HDRVQNLVRLHADKLAFPDIHFTRGFRRRPVFTSYMNLLERKSVDEDFVVSSIRTYFKPLPRQPGIQKDPPRTLYLQRSGKTGDALSFVLVFLVRLRDG